MQRLGKKDYILIGILALLIILLIIVLNTSKDNNVSKEVESNNSLVNNPSTFFTIESCANRYINNLYSKNSGNLMKLLDSKYIIDNSINNDNVLSKLDSLDGIYSFTAKKMFEEKIDDNYTKYYLYGLLKKETMDGYDYGKDYYLIITLNQADYIFSVTPYDGSMFRGES